MQGEFEVSERLQTTTKKKKKSKSLKSRCLICYSYSLFPQYILLWPSQWLFCQNTFTILSWKFFTGVPSQISYHNFPTKSYYIVAMTEEISLHCNWNEHATPILLIKKSTDFCHHCCIKALKSLPLRKMKQIFLSELLAQCIAWSYHHWCMNQIC